MIRATHTPDAPWYIVPSDNKRRARLNLIRHLLDSIPNKKVDMDLPKIPKAQPRPKNATEGLGAARRSPVTTEEGIALGAHDCSTPGASPAARPNRPMPPPFHMPVAARR
jgi:hypothetical protein